MQIIKLSQLQNRDQLLEIWNEEYGKIYPITKELFDRNTDSLDEDISAVAVDNDKVIGFILIKIWKYPFIIESYLNAAWINLLYVIPKMRKHGIGTILLNQAEEELKKIGKNVLNLGRDYHNFFPGLPIDFDNFLPWFKKRGFEFTYQTHDLIRNCQNKEKLRIENQDFTFRIATLNDKESLISFIKRLWPGRWEMETIEYFNNGGDGSEYVICLNNKNEICGFAKFNKPTTDISLISYSRTWYGRFDKLGGIGPLGIDPENRHHHLGYDIVSSAVNYLLDLNVSDIIIDWTGLLEFYRHMDFEVWKAYSYSSKKLI